MDDIEENISTLRSQGSSFISVLKYMLYEQEIVERIKPYVCIRSYNYRTCTYFYGDIYIFHIGCHLTKFTLREDKN